MLIPPTASLPALVASAATTGTTPTTPAPGNSTTAPDNNLGTSDAFMKLLVTQLENQDPLNPLQPYEFAAQLAQFTQVEQLGKISDAINAQTQATQVDALIGQTGLATAMIGRHVTADGDQVQVVSGTTPSVRVKVDGTGGHATLHLEDASGHDVLTRDLGSLAGGEQTVTLPNDLPPGDWHYSITCQGSDGKDVNVATTTSGVVTGVSFTGGGVLVRIGDIEVALEKVQDVDAAVSNP